MNEFGGFPTTAMPLWLARQPDYIRDELQVSVSWHDVGPGRPVVPPFTADTGLVGVIDGVVALRLHRAGVEPRLVDLRSRGYWCGRSGAVRATPDAMGVTTQRRSTLVTLSGASVREFIARDPAFLLCFADLVSAHAQVLTEQLDIASTRDSDARLARKILSCVGPITGARLPATQWELAEMTHSSRNTVNRSLAALEKRGALRSGYGHIVVADGARLAKEAGQAAPELADRRREGHPTAAAARTDLQLPPPGPTARLVG
ncbi:MAG: helix-turn-helix domain-containing protein [Alphaproteobacteria bacterium]|jgi:CRP-like cAMP-binding protein|nr:helix-turn-helix domain-containing protein [Alphaproteobacteria bacterium]